MCSLSAACRFLTEYSVHVAAGKGAAGMLVSRIPEEWTARHHCPLPMKRLGFNKVANLLIAIPHVAKVVTQGSSCMVYLADCADAAGNPTAAPQLSAAPAGGELVGGETTRHVREWLLSRAQRAGAGGLVASRIPSFWAEDYPRAGPLPLKQMGVNKLIKFLYVCTDILRTDRISVTELLVFPAVGAFGASAPPPPPSPATAVAFGGAVSAPAKKSAMLVRQGTQMWVKAAAPAPLPAVVQAAEAARGKALAGKVTDERSMQPQTGAQAAGGEAEARRAPGTERPAMQLRAEVIEETYGRGFAMLAKMGYKHDNLKHATNTPISVVSKFDKKGLYVAGEEASAGRGVNGKQQGETQGKDAVFVREWLYRLLLSCQGEYGTMEPLAMSRVPDLWSQQFSGCMQSCPGPSFSESQYRYPPPD